MARKRLIKGTNATRVEERIGRVPEDIGEPTSIFRALKAMETSSEPQPIAAKPRESQPESGGADRRKPRAPRAKPARKPKAGSPAPLTSPLKAASPKPTTGKSRAAQPAPDKPRTAAGRASRPKPAPSRSTATTARRAPPATSPGPTESPVQAQGAPAQEAEEQPRLQRLGPTDFSSAERETIIRCCSDYRNHLPIYLLAVQREVRIIDSVIEKCGRAGSKRRPR